MLDSDDYWDSENLEKLVDFAEKNELDMAVCGIYAFVDGTDNIWILRKPFHQYVYTIDENADYFSSIYGFLRTTWGKLIRMDILRQADFSVYKENAKDFIADDTAEESRHYVDNVFLASIIEACKLLFASDNPYSYKVGEVRRVVETEVMKDLMGKSKEAVSVLRTIIEYVLAETKKCTNITTEDVEQLKYINGLLKIYMAEGE